MNVLRALLTVGALSALAACGQDGSGAPGGHTITSSGPSSVLPPPIEARSDKSALVGGIGEPPMTAESSNHRLQHRGLQPKLSR